MALRKAVAYSKRRKVSYTRKSNVKSRSYIKTIPQQKIVKFVMGDSKKFFDGKFPFLIKLVNLREVHIRDNAIEAARMMIHRQLEDVLKGDYYFAVSVYPHHVLRENKMLTGAGADRMQTGMSQSFGVAVGIAAQIKKGKEIFVIAVPNPQNIAFVREVLKKAKAKLSALCKVVVEKK